MWKHYLLRSRTNVDTVKDLNIGTDEIQLAVSVLRCVRKRIVEVSDTHRPLFAEKILYKALDLERTLE